jgi:HlyD family secretion protein
MNAISRPRRYGVWILVALAAAGGVYYWSKQAKKEDVITLDKTAVKRGNLVETIASTGALSALQDVTVGAQVSGIVTKVLVDFNDYVKKGDLMAVIDPQTLQAQVDSSRATLAQRQTTYNEALKQLEEGKPLHDKGYLSDKDLRTLQVAVSNAKAQLDSATTDFNKQNVQLQYAEIRAPMDGIISNRNVDPGNTVQSSMQAPTMFVVSSDLHTMKILASVDETQIPLIKEGMKARFTVSGIPDKTFNATVRQVRLKSTTTQNVVTYTVVLDAENPDLLLFPGMTATINFIQSNLENVLLIPNSALRINIPTDMRVAADAGPLKAQAESSQSVQHADGKVANAETISTASVSSSSTAGMSGQRDGAQQSSDRPNGMMARADGGAAASDASGSVEGMSGRRERGQNGDHTGGGMNANGEAGAGSSAGGGGMSGRNRGQEGETGGNHVAAVEGSSSSGAAGVGGGMSGRDRGQGGDAAGAHVAVAEGGSPSGANGGGGGMSGQRQMGQNGEHVGGGARTIRTAVWMVNAEGKAYRVPVRVLGSDLTSSAVEPLQADALKEGDEIVTRVVNPNSSSSVSTSSNSRSALQGFGTTGGFGGGGGGNTGMGGGGR